MGVYKILGNGGALIPIGNTQLQWQQNYYYHWSRQVYKLGSKSLHLEIPDTSKQTFQELSWNDSLSCMTLFSCLWKYPDRWPLLATSELSSYFIVLQTTPRLRKRGRILKTIKQSLRKRVKSSRKIFLEFSFFPLSQSRSFKSILTSVATSLFCKWGSKFGAAARTSKSLIRISSTC